MWSRRRKSALLLVAALLFVLIGGRIAAEILVELLWYRALGLDQVFWTTWGAAFAVRALAALLIGGFVFANLWIVARSLGTIRVRRRYGNIEIAEQLPQGYIVGALGLIALFSAWWLSVSVSDPLPVLAGFRHQEWGIEDPVFSRDLSFYVFVLPLLERAQMVAGVLLFWTALLVVAAYVATGAVRLQEGRPGLSTSARRHLGLLLAGFLGVFAWDVWLDRFQLVMDGHGVDGSFGYTDLHARIPGAALVALAAAVAAGAAAYAAWEGRHRLAIAAVAGLFLVSVGARWIYPAAVQKLVVEPNEFPREQWFIEHHLEFTRLGYGLRDLNAIVLPYEEDADLAPEPLLRTLTGVPLWDPRPLQEVLDQQQSFREYYDFLSVHLDRYGEPGEAEQVAVAVRELIPSRLSPAAQTWQNLHLTYVSGAGVVVSPVSEMTADGAPLYYLSDLNPPKLAADAPDALRLEEANVYFGEQSPDYVVLDSVAGPVGVRLDAPWKRLVFAWAFQSKNLFLSDEVGPESRIVYRRSIVERARAAAPFLDIPSERSVHPVIADGRVVWILDGYTQTARFPFSRPGMFGDDPVRYVRNSAKVVIDGVTGEVGIYAVAPDPILRTYAALLPDLVRPFEEMPEELRRHLRFPAPLLELQGLVLGEYHLVQPRAFYEKEDVWAVATELYRGDSAVRMEPVFAMLPLAGESEREFLAMIPFVSRGRQNLTAILVSRNDPPHYGEQVLYLFPRDELVPGPQQVESQIDAVSEIREQLSLWRQGGADVIRGHMTVVPIDSTLVYVEPLFLQAEDPRIPQLERVILAQGGRVVMRRTLEEAVAALTGTGSPEPARAAIPRPVAGAPSPQPQAAAELERARRLFEQAEQQLRAGDWQGFGRTWQSLRELLRGNTTGSRPQS